MSQAQDLNWFYAQLQTMGVTERYQVATQAELYYLGLQYDGLPDPDDKTVPFRQRRPRIIVPMVKEAVDEIIRFAWGGHNFPPVAVEPTRTDDDTESGDEVGPRLDKEQAEKITRFVRALVRAAQLPSATKEASRKTGIGRSAALILGFRGGYPTAQTEAGKHCTPIPHKTKPRRWESLEIKYQHPKEIEVAPGRFQKKPYWYRRVITSTRDIIYKEVPVVPGQQPQWIEDTEASVDFGFDLGEAPVVWFRSLPDDADQIDGQPLVDPQLYPLIDDVNYTVSQRSRGLKHVIDPQTVFTGIDEEDGDFAKNPGAPWMLPENADAKFLEMRGEGIQRASEHVTELTEAFRAAVHYVKANPKTTSGHISGVVLEFLHAPMIALVSDLRVDFGDNGYAQAIALFLQMCTLAVEAGKDVWVQGVGEAAAIMRQAQLRGVWLDPPICIQWPAFFPETEQDKQARIAYTNQAVQGRLLSEATGTKHVASVFNVEDTEAERDAIEDESAEAARAETAAWGPVRVPRDAETQTDETTDDAGDDGQPPKPSDKGATNDQ